MNWPFFGLVCRGYCVAERNATKGIILAHSITDSSVICGLRVGTRGLEPPQGASGKKGPLKGL